MHADRSATSVPKRALVRAILTALPEDLIRTSLRISRDTPLPHRLRDFTKAELLAVLVSAPAGEQALAEAERNYPLSSAPTLYLAKVQHRPDTYTLTCVGSA